MKSLIFNVRILGVAVVVLVISFLYSVNPLFAAGENCKKFGGQCQTFKINAADAGASAGSCESMGLVGGAGGMDCAAGGAGTTVECCRPSSNDLVAAKSYGYKSPLGNASIPQIISKIIARALPLIGALFFVMFFWGGVQWMTAGGEDGKVKKARQTIVNSAIGMLIVMGAYAIVYNIISALGAGLGQ